MPAVHTGEAAESGFEPKTPTLRLLCSVLPLGEFELTFRHPRRLVSEDIWNGQGLRCGEQTDRQHSGTRQEAQEPLSLEKRGPWVSRGRGLICECVQWGRPASGQGQREVGEPVTGRVLVPSSPSSRLGCLRAPSFPTRVEATAWHRAWRGAAHAHLGRSKSPVALAGASLGDGCLRVTHHHPYTTVSQRSHFIYYQNITEVQS